MTTAIATRNGADPNRTKVTSKVETVTPEKAARWLKKNRRNRALNRHRVNQFAADMKAGLWRVTPQGVGFDINDDLNDGQHRLHAIIAAGVPVEILVVRGLEPESQEVVDTGQARTLGQTLTLRGEKRANQLAAALRLLYGYRCAGDTHWSLLNEVSKSQFLELLEQEPLLRDSLRPAGRWAFPGVATGVSTVMHYLFTEVDAQLAEEFFDAVATGENLSNTDPAFKLRRVFLNQAKLPADRRVGAALIARQTVKAFNAYALGQEIRQLKADRRESFPAIVSAKELREAGVR